MRSPRDIRPNRRRPQNQCRYTPSRQKNPNHHNQRNHHRRNPHRHQLCRRLRRPQPGPRRKPRQKPHHLQRLRPRSIRHRSAPVPFKFTRSTRTSVQRSSTLRPSLPTHKTLSSPVFSFLVAKALVRSRVCKITTDFPSSFQISTVDCQLSSHRIISNNTNPATNTTTGTQNCTSVSTTANVPRLSATIPPSISTRRRIPPRPRIKHRRREIFKSGKLHSQRDAHPLTPR